MLRLNLVVYDEEGNVIPALTNENAVPQQINAILALLKPNMSFNVICELVKDGKVNDVNIQ